MSIETDHNPPAEIPEPCDHNWSFRSLPGSEVKWIRTCTRCHDLDVDDLNERVRVLRDERFLMLKELASRQVRESTALVAYSRALVEAAIPLVVAVTDTYISPVREGSQKAARARLGLAHQNMERILAANGDLS